MTEPTPSSMEPPPTDSAPIDLPPPTGPVYDEPPGASPRSKVIVGCMFTTIILAAVIAVVHAPYAIFAPGPAVNLLAPYQGKHLITISGHPTYPVSGALDFTTVNELGGPGTRLSMFDVLRGWLSPSRTVLPEEVVFPKNESSTQIDQESATEMTNSQQDAAVAALREMGVTVPEVITVASVSTGVPASTVLRKGDILTRLDGVPLTGNAQLHKAIEAHKPGDVLTIGLTRSGVSMTVKVKTTKATDGGVTRTIVGFDPVISYTLPYSIKIGTQNVGGPSAGTMFALALYDTLTPGSLTGGKRIAGTGEIDPSDGSVEAIGGIQQKMVGAKNAGAQWFLAPESNCNEVVGHVPSGLTVVKISTLHQARLAVEQIAAGTGRSLPGCS